MTYSDPDYRKLAEKIDALEFDSTFTINAGYNVETTDDYAPSVYHDDEDDITIDGAGWEGAIKGFTGQDSYSGHVMHRSEYIGAAIAQSLVKDHDPGTVFAIVTVEVLPDDEDEDEEPAGWTIVRGVRRTSDS